MDVYETDFAHHLRERVVHGREVLGNLDRESLLEAELLAIELDGVIEVVDVERGVREGADSRQVAQRSSPGRAR